MASLEYGVLEYVSLTCVPVLLLTWGFEEGQQRWEWDQSGWLG